jgi:hypothetical protein
MLKKDAIGLGMGPFLAERIADAPDGLATPITGVGGTLASAYVIGRSQYLIFVHGSNSGKSVLLPGVGGDSGCLLGDAFTIINNADANGSLTVYGPKGTSIIQSSSVISGSLGVSISSGFTATFWAISTTTWACLNSG